MHLCFFFHTSSFVLYTLHYLMLGKEKSTLTVAQMIKLFSVHLNPRAFKLSVFNQILHKMFN